ncbi:MAG: hypothetical protein RR107_06855, partial [Clostridia bacterium]
MKKVLSLVLIIALVLSLFVGCGNSTAQSGLDKNSSLEISGMGIDEKYDSAALAKMKLQEITCKTTSSSGETKTVTVKGFSLKDILKAKNVELKDVPSVNLIASDGYIMNATVAEYGSSDIYVLLEYEGEKLTSPRSCIPDKRTMYWVKNLSKIELVKGEVEKLAEVSEIGLFVEGKNALTAEKIDNRGEKVDAYSLKAYFEKTFGKTQKENLKLIALDGFEKNETADVFFKNYVSTAVDKKDAPLYFSDKISDGMRVKQLDMVIGNGVAAYFGQEITVEKLFKAVGMKNATSYKFIASDGFETTIPQEALK